MQKVNVQKFYRVIDANFNRAKEGLRVCEDICRFVFDEKSNTKRYKRLRHQLSTAVLALGIEELVTARESVKDVGKKTSRSESKRTGIKEIFYANAQRVKESVRVLEEFAKLRDVRLAERLKRLRYELYMLEKDVIKRLSK